MTWVEGERPLKPSAAEAERGRGVKAEWRGPGWRILCGDAQAVLRTLPTASRHCLVTSPPYYSLRDYGAAGQIGLETTAAEYVSRLRAVFLEAHRVLRSDGLLMLNLGDTYYSGKGAPHGIDPKSAKRRFGARPVDQSGGLGLNLQRKSLIGIPWRVALAMLEDGWILRSAIIWRRRSALPEAAKDRPSRGHEHVFMFAKSRRYHFDPTALPPEDQDVWDIPDRPRRESTQLRTAPFPDALAERCLRMGCPPGGAVLDPFMGSGTTLRVARAMGMEALGVDINRRFCEYAAGQMQDGLPLKGGGQ